MPDPATKPFKFSYDETQRLALERFWDRRRLEVSALCRIVDLENPELSSATGLGNAWQRLKSAGNSSKVSRSPDLLRWLNVSRYLVIRGMHESLPMGHVRDHMLDLGRFAICAACDEGRAYECTARLQQDGRITLPGAGLALSLGRIHAGEIVRLQTDGTTLEATMDGRRFSTRYSDLDLLEEDHDGKGWVARPKLGWGILLEDSRDMFRAHHNNNPNWKMRPLDADYSQAWASASREACRLLSLVERDLWVPVRDLLFSIVPLQSSPEVNLSGTCVDVLGCICSSLPLHVGLLAETLVHESAHTMLHMLSDEISYWNVKEEALPYHSPWRKDLRPISGMLHGIFAFLGVGAFWASLLRTDAIPDLQKLGRFRLRTVALQVREAVKEICDSPELAGDGQELVAAAGRKLDELDNVSKDYEPTADEAQDIRETMKRHRDGLPEIHRQPDPVTPAAFDALWSQALDVQMPPPRNLADRKAVQLQNVSDVVQQAVCKGDDHARDWEALIKKTRASEPESAALVEGSIRYGKGDFEGAVVCYSDYVRRRWDDLDAWSLLGSALRRAGRPLDALAITFHLSDLQKQTAGDLRRQWGDRWSFHLDQQVNHRANGPDHEG